MALFHPHQLSVVLDLSALDNAAKLAYLDRLPSAISAERSRHGVPHWLVFDEAHQQAWLERTSQFATGPGSCLVTWRPELLEATTVNDIDVVIDLGHAPGPAERKGPLRAS